MVTLISVVQFRTQQVEDGGRSSEGKAGLVSAGKQRRHCRPESVGGVMKPPWRGKHGQVSLCDRWDPGGSGAGPEDRTVQICCLEEGKKGEGGGVPILRPSFPPHSCSPLLFQPLPHVLPSPWLGSAVEQINTFWQERQAALTHTHTHRQCVAYASQLCSGAEECGKKQRTKTNALKCF